MLINSRDLIYARIFTLGLVIKELGIVRYILYSAMCSLLYALVVNDPGDVWRRFAQNFNVEVEPFVLTYGDVAQVSPVDLWCHWREIDNMNESAFCEKLLIKLG